MTTRPSSLIRKEQRRWGTAVVRRLAPKGVQQQDGGQKVRDWGEKVLNNPGWGLQVRTAISDPQTPGGLNGSATKPSSQGKCRETQNKNQIYR